MTDRDTAVALDAADPLRKYRARFVIADPELIYLDGNSLGRLPKATKRRLHAAIDREWGAELIRGWDHWIDLARQAGDLLAQGGDRLAQGGDRLAQGGDRLAQGGDRNHGLVEARPGEVILADSTSVNLYKLAAAALDARPARRVIVTDDDNFPTDLYVLEGLASQRGLELRVVSADIDRGVNADDVTGALDEDVALVSLSHVAYRSGAIADMRGITRAAHDVGAMTLWDTSHSVGSVSVPLASSGADLAVGCTYKHLNGGPGAPAFLYVREDLQAQLRQPIWGWFGQQRQFDMDRDYDPVTGIERFLVGTPGVLGLYGALEGIRLSSAAGIAAIEKKTRALTSFAIELFDEWLAPLDFSLASPRDAQVRGAHVTLHHPQAWQLCQALKAVGVIPDFRTPDRLRLGVAPLYTTFVDVHTGLLRLRDLVRNRDHLAYPAERSRVT